MSTPERDLEDEVRPIDRQHRNGSRARKQAAASAGVAVNERGDVVRLSTSPLLIPEEKRCTAMTVKGERCKAGRMVGLAVCIFHSHLALTDETLAQIVTEEKPRLTPRAALKTVVALRAEELAEAAVSGALDADAGARTKAVLALVDATDPLVQEHASLTLSREGVEGASFTQLRALVAAAAPDAA
jgi:hypothetical protein